MATAVNDAQASASVLEEQRNAFFDRLLKSLGGAFDMFTIYLGHQLGLYRSVAQNGWTTSSQLASRTQTQERYVREWLEQQTVVGILEVEDESADAMSRRYRLPDAHAEVLTDCDSLFYFAPVAQLALSVARPIASVLRAFRNGGGVAYAEYGQELREGIGAMNRPMYLQLLGSAWIPAMPDVHERLQSDPPARVADIGCGAGWSSIGLAQAYPKVTVDGYDFDGPSIDLARQNARQARLDHRVRFDRHDASDPALDGHYDLVMALECVHDMSDPVGALKTMRRLAGDDGAVLVIDERVGDRFTARGNDVEWMMYGFSVLHCLPAGMAEEPSACTGTVMRIDTLRQYARQAGFREVEVLPVENFLFRLYRLHG